MLTGFQNRVLKISDAQSDKVAGYCRKWHTEEWHELYSSPNIIRAFKSWKMTGWTCGKYGRNWETYVSAVSRRAVRFVRPALMAVMQNDGDFVDVILLYTWTGHSVTTQRGFHPGRVPVISSSINERGWTAITFALNFSKWQAYILTHCGRVTQICVFNTVRLGTFASSP